MSKTVGRVNILRTLTAAGCFLVASTALAFLAVDDAESPDAENSLEMASGEGAAPRIGEAEESNESEEEHGFDLHLYRGPHGNVSPERFRDAAVAFDDMVVDKGVAVSSNEPFSGSVQRAEASAESSFSLKWESIGPAPATVGTQADFSGNGQLPGPNAGAVMDLAIDPRGTTDSVVYEVFGNGGLWKSVDGGASWTPMTNGLPTTSIGAVALDPTTPSTVYVGTGNYFFTGYFAGFGVYRSTDGGQTWTQTAGSDPTLVGHATTKMVMPAADTLLVGTSKGLFKSSDAGATFAEIPVGGVTGSVITDLDLDTNDPSHVFVAASTRANPDTYHPDGYAGRGLGIFTSTDAGDTFPAGGNLWGATHTGAPSSGSYGFVSFAQSTTVGGTVMYADASQVSGFNWGGMWKSTDGGSTWTNISANAAATAAGVEDWRQVAKCQCGYDQTIGVDPIDANTVYIGFQDMWRSTDGGQTFTDITRRPGTELVHVDHHALAFSPSGHLTVGDSSTRFWTGNDGGTWYSDDRGASWVNRNSGVATNLFRGIDTGRGAGNQGWTYGGMQDTGTALQQPVADGTDPKIWQEYLGGDGGRTGVAWGDPKVAYGTWGGYLVSTTDAGLTHVWGSYCGDGSASPVVDPNDDGRAYVSCGTSGVVRTTDYGASWQGFLSPGVVTSIAVTPQNSDQMWLGLNSGKLVHVTSATTAPSMQQITVPGAPVTAPQVAIDPSDSRHIVAVYAGYTNIDLPNLTGHVFETTDGGATWADIGGTVHDLQQMIPDTPVYGVVIDPNSTGPGVIVATDFGVLRTIDGGKTWQVLGTGLPHVLVNSLQLDSSTGPSLLKVGTFGRSAWQLALVDDPTAKVTSARSPGQLKGAPFTWTFDHAVTGASSTSATVVQVGSSTPLPGRLECRTASGSTVNCATKNFKKIAFTPSKALIAGEYYFMNINPTGSGIVSVPDGYTVDPTQNYVRAQTVFTDGQYPLKYSWATVSKRSALGGSYLQEQYAGATATFKAQGQSVAVILLTGPDGGNATVTVKTSGEPTVSRSVDTYSASAGSKTVTIGGLSATQHTVSTNVEGTANPLSTGSWIRLDGTVVGGQTQNSPTLTMRWAGYPPIYSYSSTAGASVSFRFRGTGVTWRAMVGPNNGLATVKIDGTAVETRDLYAPDYVYDQLFTYTGLSESGYHTIVIKALGQKSGPSTDSVVTMQGFTVQ